VVYIYPQIPLSMLPAPVGYNLVWERDSFRIYSPPGAPGPAVSGPH